MAKLNEFELENLLPTEDILHGRLSDAITAGYPRQGLRSAIANALAQAGGSELADDFSIRNPFTSFLGSAGLGGLIGGGLGGLGGLFLQNPKAGAILGAALGSALGGTANALHRRKLIKKIKKELVNKNLDPDKITDRESMALINPVGAIYNADELATKVLLKAKEQGNIPINNEAYTYMYGNQPVANALWSLGNATPITSLLTNPVYLFARLADRRGSYRKALEKIK